MKNVFYFVAVACFVTLSLTARAQFSEDAKYHELKYRGLHVVDTNGDRVSDNVLMELLGPEEFQEWKHYKRAETALFVADLASATAFSGGLACLLFLPRGRNSYMVSGSMTLIGLSGFIICTVGGMRISKAGATIINKYNHSKALEGGLSLSPVVIPSNIADGSPYAAGLTISLNF